MFLKRWAAWQLLWLVCAALGDQRAVAQWDAQQAHGKWWFKACCLNLISSLFFFFLSVLAGQKILHHRSDILETVVLINPSDEAVSTEVSQKYFTGGVTKAPLSGQDGRSEAA